MRWGWGEQCPFLLWNGPGASHMLGKHATTQLHPYPSCYYLYSCIRHVFLRRVHSWTTMHLQRSEKNLEELALSFHHVGSRVQTQVIKVGSKHLYFLILPGLLYFRNMVSLIKFSKMASYYIAHAGLDFACTTRPGSHINLEGNILCNSYMFQNHSTVSKINTDYAFWSK